VEQLRDFGFSITPRAQDRRPWVRDQVHATRLR
jgi:hypothetical protein